MIGRSDSLLTILFVFAMSMTLVFCLIVGASADVNDCCNACDGEGCIGYIGGIPAHQDECYIAPPGHECYYELSYCQCP